MVLAGAIGLMYIGNRSGGLVNAPPKPGKVAQKISINTLINRYDISTMYDTYCRGELRRKSTCQCFVKPLHDDIRSEFSKRQIERLIEDEPKILRRKVRESFVAQEASIGRCLETDNSSIDKALGLMCGKK